MPERTPVEQMFHLLSGYWYTQAIYVAAKLGLADLVKDGPKSADELAKQTKTQPQALYRLMRMLAGLGIFAEDGQRRFDMTPMAETLRSDLPSTLRYLSIMQGEEHFECCGKLLYSVETGKPAFDFLYGEPGFDYLSKNPEKGRIFDMAMTGVHGQETQAMLEAYDFSRFKTLTDVGGGIGGVMTAILKAYPKLRGTIYDLAPVVERTTPIMAKSGVGDRCQLIAGSFFESVPPGADAYLMRHIIHDWDDEKSIKILRNIRKAISPQGLLLVLEGVIEPGNDFSVNKILDLVMLTIPGGMERSEAEFRQLFQAGGFELARIVPTKSSISVLEAKPV